jgi:uncharacterized protein (DUF983 family)
LDNFFQKTKFEPDITHGVCPMCDQPTMLVSLTKDTYRCITCGSDLEQKINGKISYLPVTKMSHKNTPEL